MQLSREKLIIKLLKEFNEGQFDVYKNLNMDFQEYAEVIREMQEENLIKDVEILYVGNEAYEIAAENVSLTEEGLEYLQKNKDSILQKNILEILHKNRQNMTVFQIRRNLFLPLTIFEVESLIKQLEINGLIEGQADRNSVFYKISESGINLIENGLEEIEAVRFYFPPSKEIKMAIEDLLKENIKDKALEKEMRGYFDELIKEYSKDKIDKRKTKEILHKIAFKGIDQITIESFNLLIAFILESK